MKPQELNMLEFARKCVAQGMSVIPIPRGEKRPSIAWKEYQQRHPTDAELVRWFGGEPMNIAIVTGAISGVIVIDTDSPDAEAWAQEHLPPTPRMTRTPNGFHRFYKHPGVPVRNKSRIQTGSEKIKLDVRGDGGYVIGPGSLHPSGQTYEGNL